VVSEGKAGIVQKGAEAVWEEESRRRMWGELARAEGNVEPREKDKQVGLNPIGKDQHTIMRGGAIETHERERFCHRMRG
jgi:hypothetical protein